MSEFAGKLHEANSGGKVRNGLAVLGGAIFRASAEDMHIPLDVLDQMEKTAVDDHKPRQQKLGSFIVRLIREVYEKAENSQTVQRLADIAGPGLGPNPKDVAEVFSAIDHASSTRRGGN